MKVVPAPDEIEDRQARLDLGLEAPAREQLAFERGKETLAPGVGHAQNAGVGGRLDRRLVLNGHLDQLLYERGQINTDLPLADLRKRSNITERAIAADDSPIFPPSSAKGSRKSAVAKIRIVGKISKTEINA